MVRIILNTLKCIAISIGALVVCLLLFICGLYIYYEYFYQEWSPARIERITEICVPKYKIVSTKDKRFGDDYKKWDTIEFEAVPGDEMFDEIDQKMRSGKSNWKKEGNTYSFNVTWGTGFPTPKGEREDDDRMFGITMTRGERVGEIFSGWW